MTITCNDHKSSYWTVAEAIAVRDDWYSRADFVSPEERQRCIDTNTLWSLQWYPQTPVGSCVIHASSYAALIEAVMNGACDDC